MGMTDKKSLSLGALFCHETLFRSHQCSFCCLSHFHFFCHFVVLIFTYLLIYFTFPPFHFSFIDFSSFTPTSLLNFVVTHSQYLHCGSLSSRSEEVLNALAAVMPEIIGGSADLTGSNLTNLKVPNFLISTRCICDRYWTDR